MVTHTVQKFGQMFFAIGLFAVLMALVLVIAGAAQGSLDRLAGPGLLGPPRSC